MVTASMLSPPEPESGFKMRPVKSKEEKLDDISNMSGIKDQTDDNISDIFQNDPNF